MGNISVANFIVKFLKTKNCPTMRGYGYLKDAVALTIEDETNIESINKLIYQVIADKYETECYNVEKCIRKFIDKWWKESNCGDLFISKPTNRECILRLSENIKLSQQTPVMPNTIPPEEQVFSVLPHIFSL